MQILIYCAGSLAFLPLLLRPFVVGCVAKRLAENAAEFAERSESEGISQGAETKAFQELLDMSVAASGFAASVVWFKRKAESDIDSEHIARLVETFVEAHPWSLRHVFSAYAWFQVLRLFAVPWNPKVWLTATFYALLLALHERGKPVVEPERPDWLVCVVETSPSSQRAHAGDIPKTSALA